MSDSVIDQLKGIKNELSVYIPSLKKNINFLPLTLKQQREILDNLSANATSIITFFNNTSNIIKENIVDNVELLVTDRPNILINFRNNIDNNYNDIDLKELINKNNKIDLIDTSYDVETKDFKFKVSIPSLDKDKKINEYLVKSYKDDQSIIGKLYVNEVVKFINSITIIESETVINLDELSVKKAFEVIESIESSNLKKIYEIITKVRSYERDFVTLDDTQVDIGPELFVL